MNAVKSKLPALVKEELEAANRENPPFHSMHEGYAVLLEEIEEAAQELEEAKVCLQMVWENIKSNCFAARTYAYRVEEHALDMAAEAIQVAAMAQKFQNLWRIYGGVEQ